VRARACLSLLDLQVMNLELYSSYLGTAACVCKLNIQMHELR